jgi:putative ABC transport system permease protein
MGRRHRLLGLVRVAVARLLGRLAGGDSRQVLTSLVGVAVAIALMTTVGGVAVGLASQSAIQGEGVDYWVVPEASTASSVAVSVDGPKLGGTHDVATRLSRDDRVDYATPVLLRVLQVHNAASNTTEYVLVAGVVPDERGRPVLGVPTDALEPGDPYYADGAYDGPWTGEVVASDAAAQVLNASTGDELSLQRRDAPGTLSVVNVSAGSYTTGAGPIPVVVMHLGELQAVSGATGSDQADQILVSTDDPSVRSDVESLYPETTVVQQNGFSGRQVSLSSLPMAIGVTAVIAAVVIGTLFVATMMGLEVHAERADLAVLSAVGFGERSRSLVVVVETLSLTVLGSVLGLAAGVGGIHLTNLLAGRYLGVDDVAAFDPLLVVTAAVVAVVIGLLASVYPVWLSRRTDVLEVLG